MEILPRCVGEARVDPVNKLVVISFTNNSIMYRMTPEEARKLARRLDEVFLELSQ
jgi:hypothetical protein